MFKKKYIYESKSEKRKTNNNLIMRYVYICIFINLYKENISKLTSKLIELIEPEKNDRFVL